MTPKPENPETYAKNHAVCNRPKCFKMLKAFPKSNTINMFNYQKQKNKSNKTSLKQDKRLWYKTVSLAKLFECISQDRLMMTV